MARKSATIGTAARCSECGATAAKGQPRTAIIHEPGCGVALERNRRLSIADLEEAAAERERLLGLLEEARGEVKAKAAVCAELGISKTAIAAAAKVERTYVYELLPTG